MPVEMNRRASVLCNVQRASHCPRKVQLADSELKVSTKSSQESKNPMELMSSFFGGMMSAFIDPIRIGLQESVRKVSVRVMWDENGRPDQMIEVVEYLTDPAQLEKAMGMPPGGAQPPGQTQQQNKTGTGTTTGQAAGGIQQRSPFGLPGGGLGR